MRCLLDSIVEGWESAVSNNCLDLFADLVTQTRLLYGRLDQEANVAGNGDRHRDEEVHHSEDKLIV